MRRLKTSLGSFLLILTAVVPWIRWDRGPELSNQAVLFSFTEMRAYFFGAEIWAQEFYYLVAVLVVAALSLFLVTALYGRIWCGFACPQTVWTDLFLGIEHWVEGSPYQRKQSELAPWSVSAMARKVLKHSLWLGVSALTGAIFVFYFTDAVLGLQQMMRGEASVTLYGFWGGFTAMTYVMAGWGREQVCIYMCPWPRIQGGMLDEKTSIVSYDRSRGENRAPAKAGQSFEDRGHCVDCGLCVQVCPVGIDIRDGAQMECIACGLCVDGCNSVMHRFGLPANLVGWSKSGSILRPRTAIYAGLIVVIVATSLVAFQHRDKVKISVLPDRSPSSVHMADGSVRNGYTIRVINQEHSALTAPLAVTGLDQATIKVPGQDSPVLQIGADSIETFRVLIEQPAELGTVGTAAVKFNLLNAQARSVFIR